MKGNEVMLAVRRLVALSKRYYFVLESHQSSEGGGGLSWVGCIHIYIRFEFGCISCGSSRSVGGGK